MVRTTKDVRIDDNTTRYRVVLKGEPCLPGERRDQFFFLREVVENPAIIACGPSDFTKMNIKQREGFGIAVGLDQDDFTKNMVTILGEWRGVSYFKSNHTGAFIKGTFTTAIAAIEETP